MEYDFERSHPSARLSTSGILNPNVNPSRWRSQSATKNRSKIRRLSRDRFRAHFLLHLSKRSDGKAERPAMR
ncbi:hypothetical protein BDBG_17345 [Blastomyces gilchristii SLH14081]|uniref:Uncharacterized protein n=1 Tax=Blastomyces gilchristii (strain SLH14081) TaxID=559298 RepID=A0A179UR94_BLAGS|nr:uncharacterized protein BDBG_17345 [Blastomyces gilchristii SLH14081]OAT10313.1 hypothetical protein BDBG_17345 [Blastomyces gilchristii SLH14081]